MIRIMTNHEPTAEAICLGAYRLYEMGADLTDYEIDLAIRGYHLRKRRFSALDIVNWPETEYGKEMASRRSNG